MDDSSQTSLKEFSVICEKKQLTSNNPDLMNRLFKGYCRLQEMLENVPQDILPMEEPSTVYVNDSLIVSKCKI